MRCHIYIYTYRACESWARPCKVGKLIVQLPRPFAARGAGAVLLACTETPRRWTPCSPLRARAMWTMARLARACVGWWQAQQAKAARRWPRKAVHPPRVRDAARPGPLANPAAMSGLQLKSMPSAWWWLLECFCWHPAHHHRPGTLPRPAARAHHRAGRERVASHAHGVAAGASVHFALFFGPLSGPYRRSC